ncbi:MAG: YdcF family protein [Candidatus Hinthialibacter antarcticus]|nr:YdcF family protein [Candidatus Hinthialibacter antarcticus]
MNARLKLPKQTPSAKRGRYRVPLPPFAWYRKGTPASHSKSRLKFFLWMLLVVAAITVVLYAFRKPILITLGEAIVYETEIQPADVIIVLGGGNTFRAEQASKLYRENYAPRILVMLPQSISDGTPYRDLFLMEQRLVKAVFDYHNVPQRVIAWTERPVFSTYEETQIMKQWMQSNSAKSALVVSGYFQSSRAQWVFDRALVDTDIRVQVVPAPEPGLSAGNWWTDVDGILDVQNEYIKYAYYRLRGLLGRE